MVLAGALNCRSPDIVVVTQVTAILVRISVGKRSVDSNLPIPICSQIFPYAQ